jgi:hypothetical protein
MKYWASIKVNLDVQLDDIEAENAEEANSKAYDMVKDLIQQSKIQPPMRPMGIAVMCVGKSENN